jgi:uncharacterized protein YbjT (DUF2867 family)
MILLTGATGNIGRELAWELSRAGAAFRVLIRDASRAEGLPEHAERRVGDLGIPATLGRAFEGADKLFLLTQGTGVEHAANALAAAKMAGVNHIVFVSSYSVLGAPRPAMAHWHHAREELLRASGIPITILRPSGFMTNVLDWLPTILEGGYVIDPVGPGRYAPIDPADIAAVAALALNTEDHRGKAYALTGGEAFTVAEQVHILRQISGRDIEVRAARTPSEVVRSRVPNGAPPALAAALVETVALMRADTIGFQTAEVAQLLGRPPRTFADWCARHADQFRA